MRQKLYSGLRAAQWMLAAKAAVGGFGAALALLGISTDLIGIHPDVMTQGSVSSLGAALAVFVALRA